MAFEMTSENDDFGQHYHACRVCYREYEHTPSCARLALDLEACADEDPPMCASCRRDEEE